MRAALTNEPDPEAQTGIIKHLKKPKRGLQSTCVIRFLGVPLGVHVKQRTIYEIPLIPKKKLKYLGVVLDNKLTFKPFFE